MVAGSVVADVFPSTDVIWCGALSHRLICTVAKSASPPKNARLMRRLGIDASAIWQGTAKSRQVAKNISVNFEN